MSERPAGVWKNYIGETILLNLNIVASSLNIKKEVIFLISDLGD
jgi:hypothetical protein